MKEIFDNHCHLEEIFRDGRLESELKAARQTGVTGWFSSALSRQEMEWHLQQNIAGMKWCAGIHPYYEKSSENDWDFLVELAETGKIAAIGEIGLDKRNHKLEWQKNILLQQLDLAREYDLPVIFHVVKSYYELYKMLKDNFPKVHGWLHGFNSSLDVFQAFNSFDLGYSLNARLPDQKVVKAIIQRGLWQIETDAPYARPDDYTGEYNVLVNLIWVKDKIEKIMSKKLWK
ncbi:MAG: TatD family hydrolase [Candidatus Cloacimonetes bacterium]|nr:TatD family hydrolase [Candidatus Cloacimonadota bacterium]